MCMLYIPVLCIHIISVLYMQCKVVLCICCAWTGITYSIVFLSVQIFKLRQCLENIVHKQIVSYQFYKYDLLDSTNIIGLNSTNSTHTQPYTYTVWGLFCASRGETIVLNFILNVPFNLLSLYSEPVEKAPVISANFRGTGSFSF